MITKLIYILFPLSAGFTLYHLIITTAKKLTSKSQKTLEMLFNWLKCVLALYASFLITLQFGCNAEKTGVMFAGCFLVTLLAFMHGMKAWKSKTVYDYITNLKFHIAFIYVALGIIWFLV